ncbi:MAG: TauD/TfdA family dioxygenase [Rhodospirillaceae bacterium]|jgi:taurine dioxygenase
MALIEYSLLSEVLGASVRGIDARDPLEPPVRDAIREALNQHIVLVLPNQKLTHPQQVRFTSQFGTPGTRSRDKKLRPEGADFDEAVMMVSNLRDSMGNPLGSLPDGEMWFHHDACYYPKPDAATFLYAIEIPSSGGNTLFANMYEAYERIPQALKQKLKGREVLQIYNYGMVEKVDPDGDLSQVRHGKQPIFIRHRETGRIALYVNRLMTAKIEGLSREDSDNILDELFEIIENPAIIYEHEWAPGDLLIWDNQSSCHARTDFPRDERRILRRCTIKGDLMASAN